MIVETGFRLAPDDAAIAGMLGAGLDRPGMRRRLATVLEDLETAVEPAACRDVYPIERVLHERLELVGGTRIGCGTLTTVVAGADELHVAVCTLGASFDERSRFYRDAGRYVETLLLDELGTWAIDQVRAQLDARLRADLATRGRHLSSPLSPGDADWPMREQQIVFALIDASAIGVTLGAGDLMRPFKSLSLVFGAGAGELGREDLSRCHYCSIRDRCRFAA